MLDRALPDILVSDIGMPEEDGLSLLRRVRARPVEEGGRVPAVALTAYARAEDRTKSLMAGFNTHVTKPIETAELVMALANLTGRFQR
jgi:CheY-like chemotaxis protein